MSQTARTPVTEGVIEFFRSSFSDSSSAAKAQLLITAIKTNSRFVDDLIAELGHCINSCGYYPETPMTVAVNKGDIRLCEHLLQLGAALEPDHEAPTPLQWAASFSDVSIVQKLLDRGADVNFCHPGPTILRAAFEDVTSMRLSYAYVFDEKLRRDLIGSLGRTALQAALLGGNTTNAFFLLAAGAEVVGGELVMAIWNHQFEIIEGLLEKGASLTDECTIFGADTVIEAAILSGNANLLIEYGADINEPPYAPLGSTSLQIAASCGFFGIARRLLELGADPNASGAESPRSRTAIETAAENGRLDIVQLLLNSGTETSGRGRRQFVRSVALAERRGHHAIVRLLKSHAGWTEADEDLLGQKDVAPVDPLQEEDVPDYVRGYYGDESDEEGTASSVTSEEDQLLDKVESNAEVCQPSDGFDLNLEEHKSDSGEVSRALRGESLSIDVDTSETWLASEGTCCRLLELPEELDEPSDTLLSTFDSVSNLSDAYEALSEEIDLEFLPSSMSYQIREELEDYGCLEEPGEDLWASEYNRFVTELA
ncbi:unnamed protein product [Colletotrichum noveboracense]|uniref:Ankyrin repeat protein n=1 Tax=Colletotrichum noveboracense TaxID=2664923 RepID=A0A9W4RPT8_9PEZI|nr:unnamed protein product [Colletotrichum noveboracense]